MLPKYIVLLVFIYVNAVKSQGPSWDYKDTDKWGDNYENCGRGKQSPINIDYSRAIRRPGVSSPLKFHNYDVPLEEVMLHNNGNGVMAHIPNTGERPFVSGGPFRKEFKFEAQYFQFHWRYNDEFGSEHWLNDRSYSVEMQIVHKAENNLMVVLAIFLGQTPDGGNHSLDKIINKLPDVTTYGSRATIDNNFKLGDLLDGIDTNIFFFYEGTLTTPPCSDAYWYIFKNVIPISRNQLNKFWQILDKNNNTFSNSRPEFSAYGREIFKSYEV